MNEDDLHPYLKSVLSAQDMTKGTINFDKLRKELVDNIANDLISVQPIDPTIWQKLRESAVSEEQLRTDGYKPVCPTTLFMWVKDGPYVTVTA